MLVALQVSILSTGEAAEPGVNHAGASGGKRIADLRQLDMNGSQRKSHTSSWPGPIWQSMKSPGPSGAGHGEIEIGRLWQGPDDGEVDEKNTEREDDLVSQVASGSGVVTPYLCNA